MSSIVVTQPTVGEAAGVGRRNLVLAAMVFAVAMTFIDQTIVAIAIPSLQRNLGISTTGSQWIVNGYLLALASLFAFGGKLGDMLGRRRMVVVGVAGFAIASAACGFTPKGSVAEAWIVGFRVLQGATAALMFPAAVGIVAASFPPRERGRAMAVFFGISGGLTAIGPIAGGYLTQWTWRSIFWINVPVAIIALLLIWRSKPEEEKHPTRLDYRGAVLITGGMGLTVLGLAAVERVGVEQCRDVGVPRRRGRASPGCSSPGSCERLIRCCAWTSSATARSRSTTWRSG